MCVDRENRDRLAEAINRYLDEEITAFEFDEQISDIASDSNDRTVERIAHLLWEHYDDIEDHKVVLSKEEWDYFQRLLLLLRSDAHLRVKTRGVWTSRQRLAAFGIAIFGFFLLELGWGWQLTWVTIPLGLGSMLLSFWRNRSTPRPSKRWVALTPFVSVAQMLAIRRRVSDFSKRQYPPHLKHRRIRTLAMEWLQDLHRWACWLVFSPLVLLWQAFPEEEVEHYVAPA